jgi:hypothetical protein
MQTESRWWSHENGDGMISHSSNIDAELAEIKARSFSKR